MSEKKKFTDTKVGKFLTSKGLDAALEAVGTFVPGVAMFDKVKDMVLGGAAGNVLSAEEQAQFVALYQEQLKEYDAMLADTASARDMQKAALSQSDLFSKRYVYYLASFWSIFAAAYMVAVTFLDVPQANLRMVDTLTGFLIGTIVSAIISYFYGSTAKSQEKDKTIATLVKH